MHFVVFVDTRNFLSAPDKRKKVVKTYFSFALKKLLIADAFLVGRKKERW